MPVYNGIEFIEESVNSVQRQTYTDWRLLIGVNGHPEGSATYQEAKRYASPKVRVYDMETRGKANTLNALLSYASEIVCLLDVDDFWLPTKLEKQLVWIEHSDVVGTACQYFGKRTDSPGITLGQVPRDVFMRFNPIINSSAMFRADDAHWDSGCEGIEDYEMWLRLNHAGKRFFNIAEKLTYHRIHDGSAFNTRTYDLRKVVDRWRV